MVTGKRFQLRKDTVAIADNGGKRKAVTVPAGAIVKVIAGPDQGDRLIDVLWDGKCVNGSCQEASKYEGREGTVSIGSEA